MLIEAIQNEVEKSSAVLGNVRSEIARVIVGQQEIIDRLLIGIIANGHILIEGVPGLAKTLIISSLASVFDASYSRIQFTPDLLPADITGTMIYNPKSGDFSVKKGPVFANFILADEINRAPSKVQSALLEAMQERQVTLGDNTFPLPNPFFVMATQNPIEQEGTYPLPEAQIDRFFMKLKIKYPAYDEERQILERMVNEQPIPLQKVLSPKDIEEMREVMHKVYMEEKLKDYILHLVNSTRHPERYPRLNDLKGLIEFGASPRATIFLARAAKTNAYISGRAYVIPDDIKMIAKDVLRHRIILSYEAEAEELTSEDIINRILDEIEVP
ncbi:MAG: MoxR family ATPase [Candidatus Cloacimonadota bacterium]|jgi:MoxR-like ATPase|nr:MoxR family ATPase [Candidatus Cloacimonas sp.]MDD3605847.1 MoxR family ATPase [Candidatus Cloacimonas acidaminovorans]MDI9572448.1 MoxR family ATPase [Candidatus Cloacimonadota bacterium]MDD5407734.1 MoxR family ATPase [Candidatus Cloacimonas acidaminovorans]MDY0219251.1 MoxR family ATPase [Candidatus Cloacimonas acidaminovorans]